MGLRESFFECVFLSDRNEYVFHFRGWSAEEAEAHFREALIGDGLLVAGAIEVRDARHKVLRRSKYLPDMLKRQSRRAQSGVDRAL